MAANALGEVAVVIVGGGCGEGFTPHRTSLKKSSLRTASTNESNLTMVLSLLAPYAPGMRAMARPSWSHMRLNAIDGNPSLPVQRLLSSAGHMHQAIWTTPILPMAPGRPRFAYAAWIFITSSTDCGVYTNFGYIS